MAKDCPDKNKHKGSEEKKEIGMFVRICEEIRMSKDTLYETHLFGFVPETNEDVKQEEFCALSDGVELWLADTGATCHITTSDRFMNNVKSVSVHVIVGNGKEVI